MAFSPHWIKQLTDQNAAQIKCNQKWNPSSHKFRNSKDQTLPKSRLSMMSSSKHWFYHHLLPRIVLWWLHWSLHKFPKNQQFHQCLYLLFATIKRKNRDPPLLKSYTRSPIDYQLGLSDYPYAYHYTPGMKYTYETYFCSQRWPAPTKHH